MPKPAAAFWGTDFEEFAHLDAIPTSLYPKRELQGATTPDPGYSSNGPIRHQAVSLSALGLALPPGGGDKAMRITMPPSGGVTSRYMLSGFWKNAVPGDDYWASALWMIKGYQGPYTADGNYFGVNGHTHRNLGTGANGPGMGVGQYSMKVYSDPDSVAPPGWGVGLNLAGTVAQNGDGGLQRILVAPVQNLLWLYTLMHLRWSRGSDGIGEYWVNQVKKHVITGQNMQSAATSIQQRFGFYQGGSINHTREVYVAHHLIGPTRASVEINVADTGGGGIVVPTVPTVKLRSWAGEEFTTGAEFPNLTGQASFQNGQVKLSLPAGTDVSSISTDKKFDAIGDGAVLSTVSFPGRLSNTVESAYVLYWTADWDNGNRAVLRRRIVVNAAGTVISDKAECYLREAGADAAPQLFNWSAVPADAQFLKIGLLSDGKTVAYSVAGADQVYQPLTQRAFTGSQASGLCSLVFGVQREYGDVALSDAAADRAIGSSQPAAAGGASPGALTAAALTFDGTQLRSLPLAPGSGPPTTLLLLAKRATGLNSSILAPLGFSKDGTNPGRWMRQYGSSEATFPGQLYLAEAVGQAQVGAGAGTLPAAGTWVLAAVSEAADGKITVRFWDGTAKTFTHAEDIFTITPGAAISNANARLVIGAANPAIGGTISTGTAWRGQAVMAAVFNKVLTRAEFEAMVSSSGVVTRALVQAAAPARMYELTNTGTPMAQLQDLIGTAHEVTAEAKGTNTAYTTADVPYDPAASGTPAAPGAQPSVPQATGLTVTGAQVSTGGATGQATFTFNTVAANPAINFTPHATAPYGLFRSPDGVSGWTQVGAWQATPVFAVTGITLDDNQFYAGRYRDNSATPIQGDFSTPVSVVISSSLPSLIAVTGLRLVRTPGQIQVFWQPNPADELVTEYHVWIAPTFDDYNVTPDYAGAGTVSGSELTCPAFTGLLDTLDYKVQVKAARPAS